MKLKILLFSAMILFFAGCTQETQNSLSRSLQNWTGTNGVLDIYLDKGYIVAVLSNYDNGAGPVAQKISQLLARVK